MKPTKIFLYLLIPALILSCKQSQDVVSNSTFQKRKYQKGWHLNKRKSFKDFDNKLAYQVKGENHESLNRIPEGVAESFNVVTPPLGYGKMTAEFNPVVEQDSKSSLNDEKCDNIILQDGKELKVKVTEVSASVVKYKMCDNPTGPTFTKNSSDIFMIKYPNGSTTLMSDFKPVKKASEYTENPSQQSTNGEPKDKKLEILGLIGFILSILAFVFGILWALLAGTAAIVLAAISLAKFAKNPDKYKGKGFAIAALILGIGAFGLGLLLLALI